VKNRYLYLVFLALSVVVVLMLSLVFKFSTATDTIIVDGLQNIEDSQHINALDDSMSDIKDTWLSKISQKKEQKEYLYPVTKFHVKFN
jgi:hypothetical protein